MKILSIIASILLFVAIGTAQNANHPTISEVKAKYKSDPTNNQSAQLQFNVIPEVNVTLKTTTGVSKVYLKIIDNATNTIIYQVNYPLSSSTVTNGSGQKLFENNNGVIFISSGQTLTLKPYTYQVYTEDAQQTASAVFSVIQ